MPNRKKEIRAKLKTILQPMVTEGTIKTLETSYSKNYQTDELPAINITTPSERYIELNMSPPKYKRECTVIIDLSTETNEQSANTIDDIIAEVEARIFCTDWLMDEGALGFLDHLKFGDTCESGSLSDGVTFKYGSSLSLMAIYTTDEPGINNIYNVVNDDLNGVDIIINEDNAEKQVKIDY